jgi:hypothetical protein
MITRTALIAFFSLSAAAQNNLPVSVSSSGTLANKDSYYSLVSADGRYVVFQSEASNLVANDFNNRYDIFRRDLATGTTELVSVGISGSSAIGLGLSPAVSGDGRYVVWSSDAADLILGDSNATWDVFLRDMQSGVTTRLSLDGNGAQVSLRSDQPRITPDGRFVTFESDADLIAADSNGLKDCYRLDRNTGQLELVSTSSVGALGNSISYAAQPSDDGRYVCFFSSASNLVAGDTNNYGDVFWKDMASGNLLRVNVSSGGVQTNNESIWPSISGDGQTVSYCSAAGNLVAGDSNGQWDLFAYSVLTGTTTRLNLQPNGAQANSYVRSPTALSTDGRFVIFASLSSNLVVGDTNGFQDSFIRDRLLQTTERVGFAYNGAQTDSDSFVPHMTPDLRVITFTSNATNVVPGDTNGLRDIFASMQGGGYSTYCTAKINSLSCTPSIAGLGNPSASNLAAFVVSVSQVRNQKAGLLFYRPNGTQVAVPFQGGTLCVESAGLKRTPASSSGGTPAPANDCSGVYQLDFNAFAAGLLGGAPSPALSVPGNTYQCQAWGRDPGFPAPNNTTLSDALDVTIGA